MVSTETPAKIRTTGQNDPVAPTTAAATSGAKPPAITEPMP